MRADSRELLEAHVARAGHIAHQVDCTQSSELKLLDLRYRACHARLFEAKGKYREAASRYLDILMEQMSSPGSGSATFGNANLQDPSSATKIPAELEFLLSKRTLFNSSVTCGILAPAGLLRTRVLESLQNVAANGGILPSNSPLHQILKNLLLDCFISREELEHLQSILVSSDSGHGPSLSSALSHSPSNKEEASSKQQALHAVLANAISMHNVSIAQKFYASIRLTDLAKHVFVKASSTKSNSAAGERVVVRECEKLAARMISEKRLDGFIDQELGMIFFFDREVGSAASAGAGGGNASAGSTASRGEALAHWQEHTTALLGRLNTLATKIGSLEIA